MRDAVVARKTPLTAFTIRTQARAVLATVGNQSAYLSELVLQRHAEWTAALDHLLEAGWKKREIREACEALPRPPAFAASPRRACAATGLELTDTDARALLVLAREVDAGNEELRRRLT